MTKSEIMKAFDECKVLRSIRNEIIPMYMPHEVVEMEPRYWLLACQSVAMIRASWGFKPLSDGSKRCVTGAIARQLKISTKTVGRLFPAEWYEFSDEVDYVRFPAKSLETETVA